MGTVLQLKSIGKKIKKKKILSNISLNIEEGEILGLIGPNGAGKSTLIKIISGISKPTSGEVINNYRDSGIGIVPEAPAFIPDISGYNNLKLLASINNKIDENKIKESMETAGLDPNDKKHVSVYSTGMKQRLMIAQAIMEEPKLMLFDEPTNGLDPIGIIELRHLLFELAGRGHAILIASHLLHEIELMCHNVAIITEGQLIREIDLIYENDKGIEICVSTQSDWDALTGIESFRDIKRIQSEDGYCGRVNTDIPINNLLKEILSNGIAIRYIKPVNIDLEEVFLECWKQKM